MDRTVRELYRDCLRLSKYLRDKTGNKQIFKHVKEEFAKGKGEKNPEKIEELKQNAIRGLSNYYLHMINTGAKERNRLQQQHLAEDQPQMHTRPKSAFHDNIDAK